MMFEQQQCDEYLNWISISLLLRRAKFAMPKWDVINVGECFKVLLMYIICENTFKVGVRCTSRSPPCSCLIRRREKLNFATTPQHYLASLLEKLIILMIFSFLHFISFYFSPRYIFKFFEVRWCFNIFLMWLQKYF